MSASRAAEKTTLLKARQNLDPALLRQAIVESVPEVPAQFDRVNWKFVYLPARHMRALGLDIMLVQGIRGAGKSFWWFMLQNDAFRRDLFGSDVSVSIGFAQDLKGSWPERDELQQLLSFKLEPRLIWKAVVLGQIAPVLMERMTWREGIDWVLNNPSNVAQHFREFDETLHAAGKKHVVLFDGLDRTASLRTDQEKLLRGLLELVLELRGYRSLRAKIFARPDMLENPQVRSFSDASKVLASSASLDWRPVDLYGLLFQYLGNGDSLEAARGFRRLAGASESAISEPLWNVPEALREDPEEQASIFAAIAGPYMGSSRRSGRTYTWVPNHLSDALDKVSPRSFLAAIRRAADEPRKHDFALHWSGIQEGVRDASKIRVNEIQEDLPWAHDAMKMLENLVVPCDRAKMISAWNSGGLLQSGVSGLPQDLGTIIKELREMGIVKELSDGRINIPDVYRVGFGLRRRGGFAPRR